VETTNGVKSATLLEASPDVFLLFLLFVSFQDLGGVFGEIALGVGICDTDINDGGFNGNLIPIIPYTIIFAK
jgi:hypothetical protein